MEILDLEALAPCGHWRREKAKEYPDDAERNLEAAKHLDMVASSLPKMEGSPLHIEASRIYYSHAEQDGLGYDFSQAESEIAGDIHFAHESGEEYLQALIDAWSEIVADHLKHKD